MNEGDAFSMELDVSLALVQHVKIELARANLVLIGLQTLCKLTALHFARVDLLLLLDWGRLLGHGLSLRVSLLDLVNHGARASNRIHSSVSDGTACSKGHSLHNG